jgi:hypothetical protein
MHWVHRISPHQFGQRSRANESTWRSCKEALAYRDTATISGIAFISKCTLCKRRAWGLCSVSKSGTRHRGVGCLINAIS